MSELKSILIVIYILPVIAKSEPEEIFCNQNIKLSIDSVLTELVNGSKFTLFIGEDFFELVPLAVDKARVISTNILKKLDKTVVAPIDISFFTNTRESHFQLMSKANRKYWQFFKNRTLEWVRDDYSVDQTFEAIRLSRDKSKLRFLRRHNDDRIRIIDREEKRMHELLLRKVNDKYQVKLVLVGDEADNETRHGAQRFIALNGHNITAAFVYQNAWNLLADRLWCHMNITDKEWLDFCQIKDISDWINCTKVTTTATTPQTTTFKTTNTVTHWSTTSLEYNSTKDNPKSESNGNKTIIWALVCLGIVIFIAWTCIIGVLYVSYKRSRAAKDQSLTPTPLTTTTTGSTTVTPNQFSTTSSIATVNSETGKTVSHHSNPNVEKPISVPQQQKITVVTKPEEEAQGDKPQGDKPQGDSPG